MEKENVSKTLYTPLTRKQCNVDIDNSENYIKTLLKRDLPRSEQNSLENEINWHFVLDKHATENKKKPKKFKRKKYLSRKERAKLGALKLSRTDWNYAQLQDMRNMWCEYMRDNLEHVKKAPSYGEPDWVNFSIILSKTELIGSEMQVIRSNVPSLVGLSGTVVLETKCTFQVVTKDNKLKVLLKEPSVFCIELDGMKFTIFGKHMITRPSERSVKKIKTYMHPDLK